MKLIKAAIIVVLFLSFSVPFTHIIFAHHKELDATLYEYERLINENKYETAAELLSNHKEELTHVFNDHTSGQVTSGLNTLLDANLAMLSGDSVDKQDIKNEAMRLVIAVDVLYNPENPIWKTWTNDIEYTLKKAINQEGNNSLDHINEVLTAWSIIKPAMQINLEADRFAELEGLYEELHGSTLNHDQRETLHVTYQQMQVLNEISTNDGEEEQEKDLTFIWMSTIVGGFILLTLAYVAWQKYKGEKHKKQKQKQSINS